MYLGRITRLLKGHLHYYTYINYVLLLYIYTEHCAACPTRHRRHACIKMRTALPANTRTWPTVVSMLVQRRWRWANIETALGQILAFAGLHTGVVYTHPSPTIILSPADQGTFSKTAGQSQAYYNTWNWKRGTYDVNHLHILTCEVAVSRVSSVYILDQQIVWFLTLHNASNYL